MKTKLLLSVILTFSFYLISSQVPQGFNYQAVARDGTGNPITNKDIQVKVSILSDTSGFFASGSGTYVWEEEHSVRTNNLGLFSLIMGTKSKDQGSAESFDVIDWNQGPLFIGIKIEYPSSNWRNMGTSKLNSVPYAMVAEKANSVANGSKLSVVSDDDAAPDALFEVKRQDGQTVFAVYPDAVNIFVPRSGKGVKGGFAIGGFEGASKADPLPPVDYFRVTPDSVRVYIDPNPAPEGKGTKGGFAIGGYGASKGINDMYFNLTGASAVNTVAESPQILWYPNKKAFLAGNVHIGSVDSVGTNSTSLGYKSIAMGDYSQAFGYKAIALGDFSTSIGKNSIAGARVGGISTASSAFALGNATKATGEDSYALGSGAIASGYKSFAFGSVGLDDSGNPTSTPTTASQPYTVAIGMGAQATQKGSMALGIGALASGYSSSSFGYYSTASEYYATALGYKSSSSGRYSGAFGYNAKAEGQSSLALGYSSWAVNNYSTAVGAYAKTTADYASAFGRSALAQATSSVAVGYGATTSADATYSSAFGYGSSTGGQYATALGYSAQANGTKSISIGAYYNYTYMKLVFTPPRSFSWVPTLVTKYNIANDDYSIALGNGNTSSEGGLSIGSNNTARKMGAVALGHTNSADSAYSFAAGANNYARGYNAFAMGESLIAEAANSFVVGYNNATSASYDRDEWVTTDPIFVIGNGGSGGRSDAMVVAKNGNTTINGNLYVTGNISSYSGTGDNMGNHIASQAIKTNGYYINYDSDPGEGIYISSSSNTYVYGTLYTSSTFTAAGRGEITNSTDATGSTNSGSLEIANSLRLDGDEIITNTGTTLMLNNDNSSNVQVDGGTLFVDATNNRVGIGDITPSYTLDVAGTFNATSSGRFGGDVTLSSTSPAFYFTDTSLGEDDFKFEANADILSVTTLGKTPLTVLAMTSAGPVAMPSLRAASGINLYINNTTGELTKATSSIRYKNNVNSIDDISWLYNLRPVSFYYNEDNTNSLQYGLIAEEVDKVNNSLVVYDTDGRPDGVLYNNLISTLVKATQDQKKTIEELKADNDQLKQRLEKLEAVVTLMSQAK